MDVDQKLTINDYSTVLAEYLRAHSERALYDASLLSRNLVESGLGPEDIVALHYEALTHAVDEISPLERVRAMGEAHQFLLEVMIGYGVHYKEYLELRLRQGLQDLEARVGWEHERATEAERLGRERQDILSVIAHELRQPLTAARSHLQLAERYLTAGELQRAPSHLLSAREAIDRLSRLSGDLVEASRGEIPQLELVPVDACEIIQQACRWARPAVESKGISLHYQEHALTCAVRGNSDALLSIFGNLLSNAARYTPAGGTVTIRTRLDDGMLCIAVSDTGMGMSSEVQARIFEKFYRAPEARQTDARGLGLGLPLVQQLVLAHQGRLEVVSAPGKGSTFSVFLPGASD